MITIYLLRHGETVYNADHNRYCGRTDVDLTILGVQQAKHMRDFLKGYSFDAIFSSPLKRAKLTAEIASGRPGEVYVDQRLVEIDFGQWEGLRPEEFKENDPQVWQNWLSDPAVHRAGGTGENATEVMARLDSFYEEMLDKYDGKKLLVIGHNGINRLYLAKQLGMPLANYRKLIQENAALTLVTVDRVHGFNLLKLNA